MTSTLQNCVVKGLDLLLQSNDTREIGKFLAFTTEKVIAPEWLEKECGITSSDAPDDKDGQQSKYDRLLNSTFNNRCQVKFRAKDLHMEQTRRTTGKNAEGGAKNGQVRYSIDDFDVILFVIPTDYNDPNSWEYLAIPSYELEDPKMPGYCVGRVPMGIKKKYQNKAKQIIQTLCI